MLWGSPACVTDVLGVPAQLTDVLGVRNPPIQPPNHQLSVSQPPNHQLPQRPAPTHQLPATRQSRGLPLIAAATAFGTSGWKTLGMMKLGCNSSSVTTCAIASAARSSISIVTSLARASSRPRKTPGKASTLLIWLG